MLVLPINADTDRVYLADSKLCRSQMCNIAHSTKNYVTINLFN